MVQKFLLVINAAQESHYFVMYVRFLSVEQKRGKRWVKAEDSESTLPFSSRGGERLIPQCRFPSGPLRPIAEGKDGKLFHKAAKAVSRSIDTNSVPGEASGKRQNQAKNERTQKESFSLCSLSHLCSHSTISFLHWLCKLPNGIAALSSVAFRVLSSSPLCLPSILL